VNLLEIMLPNDTLISTYIWNDSKFLR